MSPGPSCHRERCARRNRGISDPCVTRGLVALRHPPPIFERLRSYRLNYILVPNRQRETNACSLSIGAGLNPYSAAVRFDNSPGDGETHSASSRFFCSYVAITHGAKELIKHTLPELRRYSLAHVLDGHVDHIVSAARDNANRTTS